MPSKELSQAIYFLISELEFGEMDDGALCFSDLT